MCDALLNLPVPTVCAAMLLGALSLSMTALAWACSYITPECDCLKSEDCPESARPRTGNSACQLQGRGGHPPKAGLLADLWRHAAPSPSRMHFQEPGLCSKYVTGCCCSLPGWRQHVCCTGAAGGCGLGVPGDLRHWHVFRGAHGGSHGPAALPGRG